ncbi:MAG: SWIB/MDM2 domain-containing protein [Gemmatimonadota bacterium]|jgi:chromatin remodeling complex protein RSC6|nr:SWIB/MDM2 domain-containing protein [Gemmatimonadota bacterium]
MAAPKKSEPKKAAKPDARGGLAAPVQPDEKLSVIVGATPLTRAELTKKIWDYVKKNNLQDPNDKRSIVADAKLKPIFGKDKVTMFEMTKLVNQHVKPA